jgi:hypothetical protein
MPSYRNKYETNPAATHFLHALHHATADLNTGVLRFLAALAEHCPHTPMAFMHVLEHLTQALWALLASLGDALPGTDWGDNDHGLVPALAPGMWPVEMPREGRSGVGGSGRPVPPKWWHKTGHKTGASERCETECVRGVEG